MGEWDIPGAPSGGSLQRSGAVGTCPHHSPALEADVALPVVKDFVDGVRELKDGVIVVDGGSRDDTSTNASPRPGIRLLAALLHV